MRLFRHGIIGGVTSVIDNDELDYPARFFSPRKPFSKKTCQYQGILNA